MQTETELPPANHFQNCARSLRLLSIILITSLFSPLSSLAQEYSWTQRDVSGPTPRHSSSMAYDLARGVTVLFGGSTHSGLSADTWEWDGSTWTQREVSGPSPRHGHAMAYDSSRGVTVLFGGETSGGLSSETWEWNGSTWTLRVVSGPTQRFGHAMTYDAIRGVTVLFGGYDLEGFDSETWEFNGVEWIAHVVTGPSPRYLHAMSYDAARGATVLFGGLTPSPQSDPIVNSETWLWNGGTWTQRAISGTSARYGHGMIFDTSRAVTILFGGDNNAVWEAEIGEWNGVFWTQHGILGPSARTAHSLAYDSARGTTVLFGGFNELGYNSETWELSTPCLAPTITTQPLDQTTSPDAPVTFFVEATSGPGCIIPEPLTYQWQRRNPAIIDPNEQGAWINLSDGNGFTNTATSALLITRSTLGLATGYRCLITGGCRCSSGEPPTTYTDTVNFSVACPADFNADGGINGEDIQAFFERWEAGC